MKFYAMIAGTIILSGMACSHIARSQTSDPFQWLEDIEGKRALDWVRAQNAKTLPVLENDARYTPIEKEVRKIVLATDRIPVPSVMGGFIYNFWQDAKSVRGVWRRTSLAQYRQPDPQWETVLDVDALALSEKENWVWEDAVCLPPYHQRCMIQLSRGGTDAVVYREFNLVSKQFVKDGFSVPEAKSAIAWLDEDHLFVGTDFGPGTLTQSGYPRTIRLWKRGTPLSESKLVFEGKDADVRVWAATYTQGGRKITVFGQDTSFFTNLLFIYRGENHSALKLDTPEDMMIQGIFDGNLLLQLRTDWKSGGQIFPLGSLISIPLNEELELGKAEPVFTPDLKSSVQVVATLKDAIYVSTLENVKGRLHRYTRSNGHWKHEKVSLPDHGTILLYGADELDNLLLTRFESFLLPPAIYSIQKTGPQLALEVLRKIPERFDGAGFEVKQLEAKSADGTLIPYFVVAAKELKFNGQNPTLLYGYGGFEVPMEPTYLSSLGKSWLERGGVYVLANIRGGGEFGPRWHQAALLENRQRAFDDFIAVAEDLIHRKITSPRHLGIEGGSNGGLLVGATFVQRPELFNAVICQVPLLDMLRYHKLLAGASWMAEYGDPDDPKMRETILKYSPYQNIKSGVNYPEVFFETSTKDDRVHPGHARKMAARMEELGARFSYFENIEGGHGAAANLEQTIHRAALEYTFLWKKLGQ